jgi:hypothetical protein
MGLRRIDRTEQRYPLTPKQILLRKLNDCDVVAEMFAWRLSVAEHGRQRAFNHSLIGNLISCLGIDGYVFASGRAPLLCIGEKLFACYGSIRCGFVLFMAD